MVRRRPRRAPLLLAAALALLSLSPPEVVHDSKVGAGPIPSAAALTAPAAPTAPAPSAAPPSPVADPLQPGPGGAVLEIRYRIEVRSGDPQVADAATVIPTVLEDARGWQQADIDFVLDPSAPNAIVVAEGEEAQQLCQPYDVGGRFSCQNGPLVVLNAIRWREGVPHWPDDPTECTWLGAAGGDPAAEPCLASYRTMLINHEVGHLLGMHHLRCPAAGADAPIMEQQSGGLRGCHPNPWPTPVELRLAATHQFAIAPAPQDVPFPP